MTKAVDKLISLGKDSVIQLALQLIEEEVDQENFSKIEVWSDGNEVIVSFHNHIKYLGLSTNYYFAASVGLVEKNVNKLSLSNPMNKNENPVEFYKETKETKRNVQFVIESINKSNLIGAIDDIATFKDDLTIRENETYYDVLVVSAYQESSFKIAKMTGKIYEPEHASIEPPPFQNDKSYQEVNWN